MLSRTLALFLSLPNITPDKSYLFTIYHMCFRQRRHPKNTVETQNVVEYSTKLGGILRTPPTFGVKVVNIP